MSAPITLVYVHGPNKTERLELRGNVARHFMRDIAEFDWSQFDTACEPRGVSFTKAAVTI